MADASSIADTGPVLVSDFDGTMTRHDFYKLAIEKLLPANTPDHWADYRSGTITHFEALRRYFAAIRKSEDEVLEVVQQMELDPGLRVAVETLRQAGWSVIVTSAGCEWYIRRLAECGGRNIVVHGNPGRFEAGRGLVMDMPVGSRYLSEFLGVDKTAVVRARGPRRESGICGRWISRMRRRPARLRQPPFPRGDWPTCCRKKDSTQPYRTWSEIARVLLEEGELKCCGPHKLQSPRWCG